jgi:hypothetical protein
MWHLLHVVYNSPSFPSSSFLPLQLSFDNRLCYVVLLLLLLSAVVALVVVDVLVEERKEKEEERTNWKKEKKRETKKEGNKETKTQTKSSRARAESDVAKMSTTSQHFSLRWNDYKSSLVTAFDALRAESSLVDVTLTCTGGHRFGAHRLLLSACSDYFREVLRETACRHPIIVLRETRKKVRGTCLNLDSCSL